MGEAFSSITGVINNIKFFIWKNAETRELLTGVQICPGMSSFEDLWMEALFVAQSSGLLNGFWHKSQNVRSRVEANSLWAWELSSLICLRRCWCLEKDFLHSKTGQRWLLYITLSESPESDSSSATRDWSNRTSSYSIWTWLPMISKYSIIVSRAGDWVIRVLFRRRWRCSSLSLSRYRTSSSGRAEPRRRFRRVFVEHRPPSPATRFEDEALFTPLIVPLVVLLLLMTLLCESICAWIHFLEHEPKCLKLRRPELYDMRSVS